MKASTKDQIKGNFHAVRGEVKENVGRITNNRDLADEGHHEKNVGKIQRKVGQVEKVFGK